MNFSRIVGHSDPCAIWYPDDGGIDRLDLDPNTAINLKIYQREHLFNDGRPVLLELATLYPRSPMQSDYMALRVKVAPQGFTRENLKMVNDGYLVVTLDEQNVVPFKRFADTPGLAGNNVPLRDRIGNGQSKFATNAFFLQKSHGKACTTACFGEFHVPPGREGILIRIRDKNPVILGSSESG